MAKAKAGRPSSYKPSFAKEARNYCLLGATDAELGAFFGVSERQINRWKTEHAAFGKALAEGKSIADARVASALYSKATGWSRPAVKIAIDKSTGKHVVVDYVEYLPPDTTAAIFWLKNRRKDDWRSGDRPPDQDDGDANEPITTIERKIVRPPPRDA